MSKTLKAILIVGIALILGGGLFYGAAYALDKKVEPPEFLATHFREIGFGGLFYKAAYVSSENEKSDTTEMTTVISENMQGIERPERIDIIDINEERGIYE